MTTTNPLLPATPAHESTTSRTTRSKSKPLLPGLALSILQPHTAANDDLHEAVAIARENPTTETVEALACVVKRVLQSEADRLHDADVFESVPVRMRSMRTLQELATALEHLTSWQPHEDTRAQLQENVAFDPEFWFGLLGYASDTVSRELPGAVLEAMRVAHSTRYSEHTVTAWAELAKILLEHALDNTNRLLENDDKRPLHARVYLERFDALAGYLSNCRAHLASLTE